MVLKRASLSWVLQAFVLDESLNSSWFWLCLSLGRRAADFTAFAVVVRVVAEVAVRVFGSGG